MVGPADFTDPACAALAGWLWSGETDLPPEGEAAALARELAASDELDWEAEARGYARHIRMRGLVRTCREKEQELHHEKDEAREARLLAEVRELRQEIKELASEMKSHSR